MILLLGGSGLLGRAVLKRLVSQRFPTRVVTRGSGDWKDSPVTRLKQMGVDVCVGDMSRPEVISQAAVGCTAIINAAGTMHFRRESNPRGVNVDAVKELITQANTLGIQRFIHVSCLGSNINSKCEYFQMKAESEELIRACTFYWTIIRPSYLFGETFPFLDLIMPLVKLRPVMPIIGTGLNEFQPTSVDDVADAILQSLYNKDTVAKTFDLPGPTTFSMLGLIEQARSQLGIKSATMHVTTEKAESSMKLLTKVLPHLSSDFIHMLTSDSTSENLSAFEVFQLKRASLDDSLQYILARS